MTDLELNVRKRFPFFETALIREITTSAVLRVVEEDDSLIDAGEFIKSVPLVLEGYFRVIKSDDNGNELLLYYLNPGEVCSMTLACCMGPQKSNIQIIAEERSTTILIPVVKLESWMMSYKSWKDFMMYWYRKRYEELLETIDGIAFLKMDERLERFFYERNRATGDTIFTGTHLEIARSLNTSREVVSRILKKFEMENRIILGRNRIDFQNLID